MKTIDLHVHSYFSDGSLSPEELTRLAIETGLSAYALTDHDCTDGIDRALLAAKGTELEVIPGIEFSTRWQHRDIHILGYFIDYRSPSFQEQLHGFLSSRNTRNEKMCEKIRTLTGFPISEEILVRRFPDAVITRAHMAAWLVEEGYVETRRIAFDKYLGDNASCFVPKEELTPADAIRMILAHQGVPVLAHPLLYSLTKQQLESLVRELKEAGLKGLEAVYVLNIGSDEVHMRSLAQKYGLLVTGGSDFHGESKPDISLGTGLKHNLDIPYSLLETLKAARE